MTFFQLFPGLTIAYIFINSPTWAAPNLGEDSFIKKGPLLLNYCVTGRCEIILNNGNFVVMKIEPEHRSSFEESKTEAQYQKVPRA